MAAFVVDASVAIKWVLPEPDSPRARALAQHSLTAPDLILVECANALWATVRRGQLTTADGEKTLQTLAAAPVALVPTQLHLATAFGLACQLGHPVYDCVYLALAIATGDRLVTADQRFVGAVASDPGLAASIVSLSSWTI